MTDLAPNDPRHGTLTGYSAPLRCKCTVCLVARNAYVRTYRQRRSRAGLNARGRPYKRDPEMYRRLPAKPEPVRNLCLRCECGGTFRSVDALALHTGTAHGRRPTISERTPS